MAAVSIKKRLWRKDILVTGITGKVYCDLLHTTLWAYFMDGWGVPKVISEVTGVNTCYSFFGALPPIC